MLTEKWKNIKETAKISGTISEGLKFTSLKAQREQKKRLVQKVIFEQIIASNFPKFNQRHKLTDSRTLWTPNCINLKKITWMIKLPSTNKEKSWQHLEKNDIIHMVIIISHHKPWRTEDKGISLNCWESGRPTWLSQ